MNRPLNTALLATLALGAAAFAGDSDKRTVAPLTPLDDRWRFSLAVPGWIAGVEGDTGINGLISQVNIGPDKIIRSIDSAALLRGEARKGRFGVMGDFLYLSLSDGIGSNTVVKKVDLQLDQIIGELAVRWRIIDHPRGSLDVFAGVRYVNLYQALALQPNSERIGETSTALVDAVGDRLRTALSDSGLRDLIEQRLASELAALEGRKPSLPGGPLAGRGPGVIRGRIQAIIDARKAELQAAIRDRAAAATEALRARAQLRIDRIKSDLSKKIAGTLESNLDTRVSRTDDWWDPFIGLRARYNLSAAWYLTAKGDIGGFGVGSDLAWQAEAALGCQVTRSIFAEAGYRALGTDYNENGLTYDTITHGAQVTVGINF